MKTTRSAILSSSKTSDVCAMPADPSLVSDLTISGKASRAAHAEHRELGHRDAVVREELLRDALVARQHQPARVAAGVRHAEQLEVARHVLVVDRHVVEVFQEIEHGVRLGLGDGVPDDAEIAADAQAPHLVPQLAQRGHDVELGLPLRLSEIDALDVVRRHQDLVHHRQEAELLHSAT
jgi:hypothetical protein